MKLKFITPVVLLLLSISVFAQDPFQYHFKVTPVNIDNMPGIHSFAYAQNDGKWLIIGGRTDGIHPRQPFASFPVSDNNTDVYVVDVNTQQVWSASITSLSTGLAEQLQATNMNFHQVEDTLYIMGGYAFSATANDHVTFDKLTTIDVPGLMSAVINSNGITPYFKQIQDTAFQITGGHLIHLGDTMYVVGGQSFMGRYNPMGHNTYVQKYNNQVRKYVINNSGSTPVVTYYSAKTDPVHLHRRDYNLVPHIMTDKQKGYMISTGVFQTDVDLPYLYPVFVTPDTVMPRTDFSQYLNHYHSANATFFDSANNANHHVFFGGMSQYYYENGKLIQDDAVPFVKTISRVSSNSSGDLNEYVHGEQMPGLIGSSSEFFLYNPAMMMDEDIFLLDRVTKDTTLVGYVVGGIASTQLNPFTDNNIAATSADDKIYKVELIKGETLDVEQVVTERSDRVNIETTISGDALLTFVTTDRITYRYYVTDIQGKMIARGNGVAPKGRTEEVIDLGNTSDGVYVITVVLDELYYHSQKVVK